jgi:dTDP-4-dehydrorhamnose 3,5-epimerase-like enzyme
MTMSNWRSFELAQITDVRGNLTVIEGTAHIPFEIARAFYIYDVPSGSARGGHAHRELRQFFLALSGSFSLRLEDGVRKETFVLNRPHIGVLVEPGVWREMDNFSGGTVCMVFASRRYDEADYIRSYEDFQAYVARNNQAPTERNRRSAV